MGILDFIGGVLGKEDRKFIEENAVADDKKILVQMGAIIIYANNAHGWTPQTLKINQAKLTAAEVLKESWDIESREEAQEHIDALISTGGWRLAGGTEEYEDTEVESRAQIDERLARYAAGDDSALSPDESEMLEEVVDEIIGYDWNKLEITSNTTDSVTTTLAWDIDRAALISRLGYNAGFFSEAETLDVLRKTRAIAASKFGSWLDYGISFMKGRAVVMCESDLSGMVDVWGSIHLLMDPKWGEVWSWAPLK